MAHWITDGSSGFTINGDTVSFASDEDSGSKFNCMWKDDDNGVLSGKHYWKIHFETLKGIGGVGLTSQDYFKKGWGIHGLCYKGNLSDGCSLLVSKFGPSISSGDTVGILASFEGDRLKVYLEINGKSLGLAFDVPATAFKSVFPIVSFHESGSATCRKETDIPNLTDRLRTVYTGIEGDWKLIGMENGVSPATSFAGNASTPTTKVTKIDENTYKWQIKTPGIHSTLFTASLSKEDLEWKTSDYRAISNRFGSGTIQQDFENLMKTIKLVQIESNGNLSIKSETISSNWMRYDPTPGPYISDVFP